MDRVTFEDFQAAVTSALAKAGLAAPLAAESGWAAAWLQAAGYKALAMVLEALNAGPAPAAGSPALTVSHGLVDGEGVSCVFLAPRLAALADGHGRIVLTNARDGLFVLPFTVRGDYGIGCPVDPSFAIGGERVKNPYAEKVTLGMAEGVEVDRGQWTELLGRG